MSNSIPAAYKSACSLF